MSAPYEGSTALADGEKLVTTGRPSWSGLLRVSLVAVPVKAYPAVRTASATSFNQLHAGCGQRIRHEKRCPLHGPVDAAGIVRGFPYAPDQYVVIEPEELEKLRPAKDKALVVEQFVAVGDVEPTFFAGRSLLLLPDGVAAHHPYGVLAEAIQERGKWGLGRVVLSTHRHLVLLRPTGRRLMLDVLHYPAQVRPAGETGIRPSTATAEERKLAGTLIDAVSGVPDWGRYRDTSAEELAALVQLKIANQPPPSPTDEPGAVLQLLDALKQSVAAAQDLPPASKLRQPRSPRRTRA